MHLPGPGVLFVPRRLRGKHPVRLSISHISYLGFASVESSVILSVTPIRGGVTDERRHGSRRCSLHELIA